MTGCDKKQCSCNSKVENKFTESDDESHTSTSPEIVLSFAVCHLPLSHQADDFKPLVDSGSSKHSIDPELIYRVVVSRMLEYTKI